MLLRTPNTHACTRAVQVLEAAHNRLRSLPTDLLSCVDWLLVLDVSSNFISAWPVGLSMPGLAVLNLSFNKLERLPDDLGQQLPALAQLYVSSNSLTTLPDSLARLQLADLFASENSFERLPWVGCE
jgi:Leucine-rich repeat (LRR) protein